MSAFLCSDRHLSAIVHAWIASGIVARIDGDLLRPDDADAWDRMLAHLYAANEASVRHRYGTTETTPAPRYNNARAPRVSGLALVKLLDCYDYQSCEVPGYSFSDVGLLIRDLRHKTIAALPEYRAAAWSI